ncbi:MAG TPA: alpha/beta hydrolase [Solirubrobacteraceae bacterium]|jgi:pimeloyl-ACP methyl ester carboxylesterase|nr:alpha/beta hydrolase [Solirubrobacteraceae bacterium]
MNTDPGRAAPHIDSTSVPGAGGVRLNVRVAGPEHGTPVLLLHGQSCSGRVWQGVMSGPLAGSARMIAPDYRGHGRSDKPHRGYRSSEIWAADIAALVAHFGLARPVLVGWSYGSAVACDYLRHGGHARAFVLVDGGPEANLMDSQIRATIAPDLVRLLKRRLRRRLSARQFAQATVRLLTERALPDEQIATLVEDALSIPPHAALGVASRRYQNDDVLRAFAGPILQIHGAKDRIRLVHAAERRTPLFRHGRTEIWPDTGHAPFLDDPERFDRTLDAFLLESADS